MKEPFDITIADKTYSVFPEEDNMYTIFKEGEEYVKIQWDKDSVCWLKLDPLTELPLFEEDQEVNQVGLQIQKFEGFGSN